MTKMNLTGNGGPAPSAPSERRSVIAGSATAFLPLSYTEGDSGPETPNDADDQVGAIGRLRRGAEPAADDRGKQAMRGSLESEGGVGGVGKVVIRRQSGSSPAGRFPQLQSAQNVIKSLTGQ